MLTMVADLCHFGLSPRDPAKRKVEILTSKTAGARNENTLISGVAERKVDI